MRPIFLAFLLVFCCLLLNCNNTKLKESESQKILEKTETQETFSLINPINKPEEPLYTTLYNGYSIAIKSNSTYQELVFKKGNVEITKTLKFYYENPEIVFHLYKSDVGNIVILIEGRDYYGSNLGVYYIDNKTNRIIEIDDTLTYTQDDPETKGFKLPKAEIIKKEDELKCTIYLGNKLLYDKNYEMSTIEKTVYKINSDFNNYKTKYSIEVLKNTSDKDAYDQLHFNLPVRIYKGNTLWKSNDHLIFDKRNSCISEGFSTVVVKNNYFTIEHQDCSDYNILVNAYITFKVSGNEIYLYKYGESYFDKSNHERNIPTKTWTEKNFGKIKFEEVTAELLQKLE